MYRIARLPSEERQALFQNTGAKTGLNAAVVEKDFWVCLILDHLFYSCKWKDRFAFKGVAITLRESISASDNNWSAMFYTGGNAYFARKYEVRIDTRFEHTMRHCGTVDRSRQGQDGTWITESMVKAYVHLHQLGLAHSFETYYQGEMVGGLYGVSLGPFFFGESMFHTMADASKVAFVRLVQFALEHHFRLIDAQQESAHLASLGARPIPRSDYLMELNAIRADNTIQGNWGQP